MVRSNVRSRSRERSREADKQSFVKVGEKSVSSCDENVLEQERMKGFGTREDCIYGRLCDATLSETNVGWREKGFWNAESLVVETQNLFFSFHRRVFILSATRTTKEDDECRKKGRSEMGSEKQEMQKRNYSDKAQKIVDVIRQNEITTVSIGFPVCVLF